MPNLKRGIKYAESEYQKAGKKIRKVAKYLLKPSSRPEATGKLRNRIKYEGG